MMMHPPGTQRDDGVGLQQLWRQVCASRGTPAPDAAQCGRLLQGLGGEERHRLESVLRLAARDREQPGDLGLISWAAACTRPALLSQLQSHGLGFTSADLFACGLALRQEGWDMQMRLAQLASHPEDVDALRAWLPAIEPEEPQAQALAAPGHFEEAAVDKAFVSWLDDDHAPGWDVEPMEGVPSSPAFDSSAALPVLPIRFARQRPVAFEAFSGATTAETRPDQDRLRLRLFGKAAAHTLEVSAHRRAAIFWACRCSASTRPMPCTLAQATTGRVSW